MVRGLRYSKEFSNLETLNLNTTLGPLSILRAQSARAAHRRGKKPRSLARETARNMPSAAPASSLPTCQDATAAAPASCSAATRPARSLVRWLARAEAAARGAAPGPRGAHA
eukprot:scaffold46362_cov68-Phaeocystis_antarctica.AAC.2